jgi:hypothetical protein
MKKIFKIIGLLYFIMAILAFRTSQVNLYLKEKGIKPNLTDKIQEAINQKAWDSTTAVSFTYGNHHHYLWDKKTI